MNKNDALTFAELEVGDYFSINKRKYRKIPDLKIHIPEWDITLNAFDIQANTHVVIEPEEIVVFIKHARWMDYEKPFFPNPSTELSELEYELDTLENYLEFTENFIQTQKNEYSEIRENFPDDVDIRIEAQELGRFSDLFEKSFFIILYSALESNLFKQCRSLQNVKTSIDDFECSNIGLEKVKKYLKSIGSGLEFESSPYWVEIKLFQKLRNCLTHNNGIVPQSLKYQALREYINNKDNIYLEKIFGADYVFLNARFCWEALNLIGHFLRAMLFQNQADDIV